MNLFSVKINGTQSVDELKKEVKKQKENTSNMHAMAS